MTTAAAAEALGYHRNSVNRLCATGRIKASKCAMGGRGYLWIIPVEAVKEYRAYRNDPRDLRRPKFSYSEYLETAERQAGV